MRRGIFACASALVAAFAAAAAADPDHGPAPSDTVPPPPIVAYAALPGGMNVPSAITLPKGALEVGAIAGFGYRKGLLASDERFMRLIGDIAIAYAPTEYLSIALSLDGRYDRHWGLPPSGDDGYVGDPHVIVRLGKPFGEKVHLALELGLWVPGKDAPSVAGSAISGDLRALASFDAGPGLLTIEAGFDLDNSGNAISTTDRTSLSPQDQVSLGLSDYSSIVGGASYAVPFAHHKAYLSFEGSISQFVGSGAPSKGIYRGGVIAGLRFSPVGTGYVFVEGAKVPGIERTEVADNNIPVLPYEPIITGGIGLQAMFGGPKPQAITQVHDNDHTVNVVVEKHAEVHGLVTDDSGTPLVGAKVIVTINDKVGTAVSDDKGAWDIKGLPLGNARVDVTVDGKKPGSTTLALAEGDNAVPKLALDAILPPGQLRGVVHALSTGKPITNATITVTPGDVKVTVGADGKFSVDLAPGQYDITVAAPGLQTQKRTVTVEVQGVNIMNIDMRK